MIGLLSGLLSCRAATPPATGAGRWVAVSPDDPTMDARLAEESAVDETCRRLSEVTSFPVTVAASATAEKNAQEFIKKTVGAEGANEHGRVALARAAFLLSMQLANDIEAQTARASASLGWLSLIVQPVVSRLTAEVAAWSVESGVLAIQDRQRLPSVLFSAEACRYYGGTEPRSTVARAVARRLIVRHGSQLQQRSRAAHDADCAMLAGAAVWQAPSDSPAGASSPSPASCDSLVHQAAQGHPLSGDRGARESARRCGARATEYTTFSPAPDGEGSYPYAEESAKRAFETAKTACLGLGEGAAFCSTEQVSAVAGAMILANTEPAGAASASASPSLGPSDFQAMMSKLNAIEQSTLGIQRRLDDLSGLAAGSRSLSASLEEAKRSEALLRSQLRDAEKLIARMRASEASGIRQSRIRVAKLFVPELKIDASACDQPQAAGGALVSNFVVSLENLCSLTTPLVILASWGGFSPGNTGLPAAWDATLSQVARELSPAQGRPAFQVTVAGHSDCTPVTSMKKDADSWWDEASRGKEVDASCEVADVDCRRQVGISWKRASDVAKKLRSAGITAIVQAKGTTAPVCRASVACDRVDEACRQQNRRIALSLSSSSLMLVAP